MPRHLKEISERLTALDQTSGIIEAMYTISVTKQASTHQQAKDFTKVTDKFDDILSSILHTFGQASVEVNPNGITLYILITSDKGLCGSYHNEIFRDFQNKVNLDENNKVFTIGRKGYSHFLKKHPENLLNDNYISNKDDISLTSYEDMIEIIYNLYVEGALKECVLVYNKLIDSFNREVVLEKILPFEIKESSNPTEYEYDQEKESIYSQLINLYLNSKVYGGLMLAKEAEHQTRMLAMQSAKDNIVKTKEELNLLYNQARQEQITTELIDIMNASKGGTNGR